jgi:hypothetical protein
MSATAIIPSENLDISRVIIGDIRANKAGGKSVPIKYNGQNLQVRIPRFFYPAGVMVREDDTGKRNFSLMASLKGLEDKCNYAKERSSVSGEVGQLYNFMLDLQEKVIQHALVNSSKWFGKSRSEAVLRETFKPILNPSVEKVNGEWVPSGKWPPSLRMKVSVWDDQVGLEAVDPAGNPIAVTLDNIEQVFAKRIEGRMVIAPSIYVTGTGFGVTWRVILAKVFPPSKPSAKSAFADIKEPDEPKEDEDEVAPAEEQQIEVPVAHEEEEPTRSEAPAPLAPAPAAATKGRKRAAVSLA